MDETPEEPALEPGLDQGEVHERLLTLVTAADPDTRQREMQLLHEMSLDYRNYLFGELQQVRTYEASSGHATHHHAAAAQYSRSRGRGSAKKSADRDT